ncbi:hypothetical protein [Volucribacter psittacicida]|nr:hypothetical protein [Volucribacter psittacicida]
MISGCSAFGLIYASAKDTTETKRQVLSHNQLYQTLCQQEQTEK